MVLDEAELPPSPQPQVNLPDPSSAQPSPPRIEPPNFSPPAMVAAEEESQTLSPADIPKEFPEDIQRLSYANEHGLPVGIIASTNWPSFPFKMSFSEELCKFVVLGWFHVVDLKASAGFVIV